MRSFPTAFAAEKNKKTGIAPIFILKLTVGAVDYYLSDDAYTVASWSGGVVTKAWVASWGSILEQVSGTLDEVRIADLQIGCVIDPDASPNIETLAVATDLEKAPAILYLWFAGLNATTDPPQEIFRGYVREAEIPDETSVSLTIEDATVRLHNLVGTLVTTAIYPNADPDHVGKILPLPYGTVRNVPAVSTVAGLLTTLKADLTAVATSCTVARPDGIVANTTKFRVNGEIIRVTAVSGDTLTISRAQDSTAAAAHQAGDRLLEVMANPLVFVVSGHALTSIDKVLVRAGEVDVDVTDQCTTYTGQVASQYGAYGAKGVVTITEAKAAVIRGRVQKAGQVSLTDPEHIHAQDLLTAGITPDSHTVVTGVDNLWPTTYDQDVSTGIWGGPGVAFSANLKVSRNPVGSGVPKRIRVLGISGTAYDSGLSISLYFRGNSVVSVNTSPDGNTDATSWYSIPSQYQTWDYITSLQNTFIRVSRYRTTDNSGIDEVWMEVEYDPSTSSASTGITASVNSVADLLLGGPVHADVTAPNTDPDDVFSDLLATWGGGVSLTLDGSYPASYKFNGVLLAQEEVLQLLHRLAFQCRSWFRLAAGSARLIARPDALVSEKTIAAVRLDGGRKAFARRKADANDIVNKINLRYDRDWTKPAGDDAYKLVSSTSDATSITDYGERERPELFWCDFITGTTMADSVRDFYLADLKRRKWIYEFEVYLDHAELEFGDVVTLGFSGNAVVELLQAGFSPGGEREMPGLLMVGRG